MSAPAPKASPTFEFCKRKRWADLVIGELGDAILLILSPAAKILYCGNAVTELLGWRDDELLDLDFGELVTATDQASFMAKFNESTQNNSDMLSYVRLKPKKPYITTIGAPTPQQQQDSQAVMFEINGYPHFVPALNQSQCQCFFAVAKPYPSRNMAMLSTFIDVKMENERLFQRIQALRSRPGDSAAFALPQGMPSRATAGSVQSGDLGVLYSHYNTSTASFDDPQASVGGFEPSKFVGTIHGGAGTVERDDDDSGKKRKLSKMQLAGQHVCVTCGRTDSPEWRKGPQGPKTLCNACGLRWAKSTRSMGNVAAPAEA